MCVLWLNKSGGEASHKFNKSCFLFECGQRTFEKKEGLSANTHVIIFPSSTICCLLSAKDWIRTKLHMFRFTARFAERKKKLYFVVFPHLIPNLNTKFLSNKERKNFFTFVFR